MIQMVAWITSLVFMLAIAAVFIFVAIKSTQTQSYESVVKKWYKMRKVYGISLVILMVVISIYSLRNLPYNAPIYSEGNEPTIVDVEALQFGWNISEREFIVGQSIEFHVTTADVTHGFGIYDEDMKLIAQTQAMPEYTNKVYITFDKPGTYQVLCMEYCGVAHHVMADKLVVK